MILSKKMPSFFLLSFLVFPLFSFGAEFITIGTGSITGTYYPTGGAVCRFVNKFKKETKIRCSIEATKGSEYNIKTISDGELDFGIAQSDVIYHAVHGENKFKNKPTKKLRAVMAIYPELFTLITRKDANIKSIMDIKEKRINIGNKGSGDANTAQVLFSYLGLKNKDLKLASVLKAGEAPDALYQNKIDGYFFMVGHPTANIKDAANSTAIRITPIQGKKVNNLIKDNPYFSKAYVPGGLYKGVNKKVPTFGVKAVLVTSSDISEKVVYTVVKSVLENFDTFKKLHPAFKNITKKSLLKGITIPLHKGAKRYYKEAGLL